jgi:hypothetical protein
MSHDYTLSHSSETILHSDSQRVETHRKREKKERNTQKLAHTHIRWQSYLKIPLKIGKSTTRDRLGCTFIYINLFTHTVKKIILQFPPTKRVFTQAAFFFVTFPPAATQGAFLCLKSFLKELFLWFPAATHGAFCFSFFFYVSLSHPRSHRCFLGKHFIKIVTARQNTLFFFISYMRTHV